MKKVFKYLILILIFLIVTSFVVSSAEAQQICTNFSVTFGQDPTGMVTRGTKMNFTWEIRKAPPSCLAGEDYKLEIRDSNGTKVYQNTFQIPSEHRRNFSGNDSWKIPDNEPLKNYTSHLIHPMGESIIKFKVVETLLVIRKFNDTNMNNRLDKDVDKGLPGWVFNITNPDGENKTYRTDREGKIKIEVFPKYEEKNYIIEEVLKRGWKPILPIKRTVHVPKGETRTVEFLNKPTQTWLLIQKFNDTNRNFILDDEEKLPGWEFQVTGPDGKNTTNFTTDSNGEIRIGIPEGKEGDYTVEEKLKPRWEAITPTIQTVNVPKGETTTVKFSNIFRPPPKLIISKFYDHNLNRERDEGEEGLENWEFEIKFPDGSIKKVTTDPEGRYIINDPPIGPYRIDEIDERLKKCWKNSTPTVQKVEIKLGQGAEVEFGNYEVGTLHIHEFNDTNHNGNWDAGELPVPNRGFRIKDPNGIIDITRYTTADGSITVELPANVRYNVSDTLRVGWNNSTPLMQYADIKPCEDTWLTFGNYNITSIVIHKFNDTNGNGVRDRGEEGLAGWEFRITGPGVDKIITTDENGKAIFKDVILGQYVITETEVLPENWINTTPRVKKIEVEEGQTVKVKFGNCPIVPCDEIYPPLHKAPLEHNNSDENLNVSKYLDPRVVNCLNPDEGEIINVTLRVCVFPVMAPTDIVLAVDTSGSVVETGGGLLEVMKDGVTDFMQKNEARFGENVRIGLVSWDDDIDETVNLTTDYGKIKKACSNFSGNLQEFTLYQEGLNGSVEVFNRTPREDVKRIIVFITDAKGEYRNITRFPNPEEYTIHSITIGPTQNKEIANMLGNLTSQYGGENVSINESSYELEKELTNLTVSCIERRTLRNVTVVETLPNYMRALKDGYEIPPTSEHINLDGIDWNTVTMKWDIGDLSSDECWENTFKAIFCCRVPADVTQPEGISGITSEVTYSDPTNFTITKHLLIPEGGLWIEPPPTPTPTPKPSGFETIFAIAALLAVAYLVRRRRKA